MQPIRFCLLAVFVGGAAIALEAQKFEDAGRGAERHHGLAESAMTILSEAEVLAGTGGGCKQIGAFLQSFTQSMRYRGNAYRIEKTVTLTEIQMELAMDVSTPLHVAIHRRNGAVWERYPEESSDYVIANPSATGLQNPTWRTTGDLNPPVILEEGFDYAIAFGWAGSVRFGLDFSTYPAGTPQDFDFGLVLGQVALNDVTPPIADVLSAAIFTSGAYSMQLCVSGACCVSGQCLDLSQNGCLALGGQFTASGVTCDELAENNDQCPLPLGACCLPGFCAMLNSYTCTSSGGAWNQGIFCSDQAAEPCAPRGGCCFADGSCQDDRTVTSCGNAGGIYRGDGIGCSASPTCQAGACCFGETCPLELTPGDCAQAGGVFKGRGISCAGNPCIARGACCTPSTGACQDNVTQSTCTSTGRSFRGDGTVCAGLTPPCGRGACCITGQGCEDLGGAGISQNFCQQIQGGSFRGDGTTCNNVTPRCSSVCCFGPSKNSCAVIQPEVCESEGAGTVLDYSSACPTEENPENSCSEVTSANGRACCLPHGECVNVYSSASARELCEEDLRGEFHSDSQCSQIVCEPVVPTGSCCNRNTFVCTDDVRQADCNTFGDQWTVNVTCANLPNPCLPRGACCDREALSCSENVLEDDCEFAWSAGLFCDQLEPICAPTGACCIGAECAEDRTSNNCFAAGGVYQGDDSVCDAELCLPRGACCVGLECSEGTEPDCDKLAGTYQGNSTICEEDTCTPRGACCIGTSCTRTTRAACEAEEGEYLGDDTECEEETCSPVGACCLDSFCVESTQNQCSLGKGVYQGDESDCDAEICLPVGACCNGLDCSQANRIACAAGEGIYLGDGIECEEGICIPRGACCNGTECTDGTQDDCDAAQGFYVGDGTSCIGEPCALGACCAVQDCSCEDGVVGHECAEQGGYFLPGTECVEGLCVPVIVSGDPPNCAIDARQPEDQDDNDILFGWDAITLTMSCDVSGATADDFELIGEPDSVAITIESVNAVGTTVEINFSGPIPVHQYTCIQHVASQKRLCLGYLPGDVDQNGTSEPEDIEALVAGLDSGMLEEWQCDLDRSGLCTPLDILRGIEILEGSEFSTFWNAVTMPVPCPTAP